MGTSGYKGFEAGFHIKGHDFMLPLNDAIEEEFCCFSEECFDFPVFHHKLAMLFIGNSEEVAICNSLLVIPGRWLCEK